MKPLKPVLIKLLIAAAAIWIIATAFFLAEIYLRLGNIEHKMVHAAFGVRESDIHH